MLLEGRTCLVTGAPRRTGAGIARGKRDANVVVGCCSPETQVVRGDGRVAEVRNTVGVVQSLAGEGSSDTTGQVLGVDGGAEW
jgi:NAD(P)-dependent dehydrogenase (short-subunit alcohol dehydrogenase family)